MDGDSDDFGLDNTDDFEIDHHGDSGPAARANAQAAGSSLFSGDDDDFGADDANLPPRRLPPRPPPPGPSNWRDSSGLFSGDNDDDDFGADDQPPRRAPAPPPRPPPQPASNRGGSGSGLYSGDDDDFGGSSADLGSQRRATALAPMPPPQPTSNRAGSSSGLFSGDGDDDFGADSADLAPPRRATAPPPKPLPPPPSNRRDSGGLFSEDDDGEYGLGLSAGGDLSVEIDHGDDRGRPASRQLPPPANYTDPSVSLDANDSDIADLLGPQTNGGAPAAAKVAATAAAPPRPGPARTVTAPPPPPDPTSPGGYGLEAEDSELRELLGEEAPPRPALGAGGHSNRRITFQEPVAAPMPPPPRPPAPRPDSDSFGDSVGDSSGGYGLERDAGRDLAAAPPRPAPRRDTPSDDEVEVTLGARMAPAGMAPTTGSGSSFRRIPAPQADPGQGYGPIHDPLDSPVGRGGRPPPRGIPPRRQVNESGEAYNNYNDDYDDDFDDDDAYGVRGGDGRGDRRGGGGASFRRIPAPDPRGSPPMHRPAAPSPPGDDDEYDNDQYDDDEDIFADDDDWDGEIHFASGGGARGRGSGAVAAPAVRPSSARQPRSRGPHASGGARMRATSALPPRERQAAMIEDMMSRNPATWDIREVATWVEFIGLGQYRSKFVHNSVDGGLLLGLGEGELARDLRILPLGHRRALLAAIAQLKEAAEAMEQQRGAGGGGGAGAGADGKPRSEAARVAELRRRAAEQGAGRRPSSAGAHVIPPEPFLGPAAGKMTVYEQRAKLLYQLDRAKHRAAQHAAIIEQLSSNKALTEAQVAELRGKLKDLETKHKDELSPGRQRGMTAPVAAGGGAGGRRGAAGLAAAEYGADAAVPWLPVGRGTRTAAEHPERLARRPGEDQDVDLTFRPRVVRLEEVPGFVRDIVAKALTSRTPFWQRMEFEFRKMAKEREAREEARRKRRERMGVVKRGGEGEDEEQAKSPHWNNYWVPNSNKTLSYHKNYKRGSENEELKQYRSFTKDKERLSRWFKRFVEEGESTEGDVTLERLVNRMIRALVKTKAEVNSEVGDTFDKRIRTYFAKAGYKFETHTSNTIKVRARGAPRPSPDLPDTNLYDFEEVEQYYPDYLKRQKAKEAGVDPGGGGDDDGGNEVGMVPKRTTWKRLVAIYYMERQKKLRAAIAMVKMCQFVQRHGARWPPERDTDSGKKAVWVPNSAGGALHQLDGRDRTFNTVGQDNISLHAKLKKALGPPQPVTFQMQMKQQEEAEAKADAFFARMGWPHSSGDPDLGPPAEPLLLSPEGGGGEGFGLEGDGGGGGGRRRWAPRLDFFGALDELIDRALELRRLEEEWVDSWHRARERGYGEEDLSLDPPRAEDLAWGPDDPLVEMQSRAMERQRQEWLLAWERSRRRRERQAARMREQGYREEDIEQRLGPQQEANEVEDAVQNHLLANVELLARFKPADLLRFKTGLRGTKKMMAVHRALRSQMFLDEMREREARKEESLRAVYESLRPGSRRVISAEEEAEIVARMEEDAAWREARRRELVERKLAEEESSLTPWYLRPRPSSRPPSQPGSRATSPGRATTTATATTSPRGRRSTRSPPSSAGGAARSASTPRRPSSAGWTRGTPGGGVGSPLEGEGSSRSKYVFGSSTPKSMWGPMGPVRQTPRRTGTSLLDSPGLQGGVSMMSLDQQQQRTPGGTARSGGGGAGATPTPTRQRPSTSTRTSAGGSGSGTPGAAGRSPAPPQRPRSAPAPPASPSRPSSHGGAAGTQGSAGRRPTPTAPASSSGRASGGGGGGSAGGAPGARGVRPSSAVPPSPRSRGPPASPGRGRSPGPAAVTPASPRRSTPRVGFAAPPSPTRSSGGGSFAARSGTGGRAGGSASARRGLMDGDTTSGTPSPERGPPRRDAGGAGAGPGSAAAAAAAAALQRRRGLADTDSSPSPEPRGRRPSQPGPLPASPLSARGAVSSPAGGDIGAVAPPSRRSSAANGSTGPARAGRGQGPAASRAASGSGGGGPPPPEKQSSLRSGLASPMQGLSQQGSASSGLGLPMGSAAGRTAAAATAAPARGSATGSASGGPPSRVSGTGSAGPRASATGSAGGGGGASTPRASATGSAADGAPGSRRPSTPPHIQQESSSTSSKTSASTIASGRAGGGGTAGKASGAGSMPQRSPLSRSPAAASPPGAASPQVTQSPSLSPPAASPTSRSPAASSPRGGSAAPSPQASQTRMAAAAAAVEAEATEGTVGLGDEDEYALDEYELDAEEGAELDYGDVGGGQLANADVEDF